MVKDNSAGTGKNIHLPNIDEAPIQVIGKLTPGANMGVSVNNDTGVFTTGYKSKMSGDNPAGFFFASDDACAVVKGQGGEAAIKSGWSLLQAKIDAALSGDTIVVDRDCTAVTGDVSLTIPEDKELSIDLNGHTLNRNLLTAQIDDGRKGYGSVFYVKTGAKLTVNDSSEDGAGTITGNAGKGAGVNVDGTFVLEGGAICVNHAKTEGGGVRINESATFKATGGLITPNNTDNTGGGVYVVRGGVAELSGCQVV